MKNVAKLGFTAFAAVIAIVFAGLLFLACGGGSDPQTWLVTVTGGTGGGNYVQGATVNITANSPIEGQQFKDWTTASAGVTFADANSASTSFTMPANAVSVTANFEAIEQGEPCTECGKNPCECEVEGDPDCDHEWGEGWLTTIHPTCIATGSQRRECTLCPRVETMELAAIAHTPAAEWTITVHPTCTATGTQVKRCTECNTITDTDNTIQINPNNHVSLEWIESSAGDTEILTCTDCGAETISRPITLILDSIAKIEAYLAARTGTLDAPLTIAPVFNLDNMSSGSSNWQLLLNALETAKDYVNLDLTLSTMNGTAFDPVRTVSAGKSYIMSLTLPDAATSIEGGSITRDNNGLVTTYTGGFQNFSNLKAITGRNVISIGDAAFVQCNSLTSVDFPAATSIGDYAFNSCNGLSAISFPAAKTIGENAFNSCENLIALSLPAAESIVSGTNYGALHNTFALQMLNIASLKSTGDEYETFLYNHNGANALHTLIVAEDAYFSTIGATVGRFSSFVSYYNGAGNKQAGTYGWNGSSWVYGQAGELPTPTTPTNLTAEALVQTGTVWLRWDVSTDATGYRIERSTSAGGVFVEIGVTITNEFDDLDVQPSTTYYYRVIAVNAAFGNESPSYASANETTPAPPSPLARDSALIGTWEGAEVLNADVVYVFNADGTTNFAGATMYTWWTRDGGIVLSYLGQESSSAEYTIAGNTLTITSFNGVLLMGAFNKN